MFKDYTLTDKLLILAVTLFVLTMFCLGRK